MTQSNNNTNNLFMLLGATPISFSELSLSGNKIDPITKVPFKSFYTVPSHFKIPKVCIVDLINLIETTIFGIKKLRCTKIRDFVYSAEYDPIEGMQVNPNDKQYKQK